MSTTSCGTVVDRLESLAQDLRAIGREQVSDRLAAGNHAAPDLQDTPGEDTLAHALPAGSPGCVSAEILHALRGALTPAMMVASYMEKDCSLPPAARDDAATVSRSVEAALEIIKTLRQQSALKGERS